MVPLLLNETSWVFADGCHMTTPLYTPDVCADAVMDPPPRVADLPPAMYSNTPPATLVTTPLLTIESPFWRMYTPARELAGGARDRQRARVHAGLRDPACASAPAGLTHGRRCPEAGIGVGERRGVRRIGRAGTWARSWWRTCRR